MSYSIAVDRTSRRYTNLVAAIGRGAYPALRAMVQSGIAYNAPAIRGELSALSLVASKTSVRAIITVLLAALRDIKANKKITITDGVS